MAEKQQPWGKWFWGDWRKDARLRRCGYASRGLWADMLSLMGGECDRFGFLIMEGEGLTAADLAQLLGGSARAVAKMLAELENGRIYSRTGDRGLEADLLAIIPSDMPPGVIFSRRMVRDKARSDRDKQNGKDGGNPALMAGRLNGSLKRGVNPPIIAHILESESRVRKIDSQGESASDFDLFFEAFPKKERAKDAARAYWVALAGGASASDLLDGARRYAAQIAADKTELRFVKLAKTWLAAEGWRDQYGAAPQTNIRPIDDAALRAAWNGEAAKLIDALGDRGALLFQTWFQMAEFTPGDPSRIRVQKEFARKYIDTNFAVALRRAFGKIVLEVAA